MRLITFSGTDGSGKSTQLSLLREYLEGKGFRVAYFHALEFSVGNRTLRFLKGKKDFRPGSEHANVTASPVSVFLRTCSLLVDLIAFPFHRWRLGRQGYDILLSDRYFFDTIVNIEYLAGLRRHRCTLLPLAETLVERPDLSFFLDIDPESVMRRDNAPEQGIEYVRAKRDRFRTHITDWGFRVLDADREKNDLSAEIKEIFDKIFQSIDKGTAR
ncbi:MAG: hypothetical protein HGA38_00805 [Candidatus Moranbacteria bacterium]|nr:hypothetical protein [Candidatus Moranbacteria bacterium]